MMQKQKERHLHEFCRHLVRSVVLLFGVCAAMHSLSLAADAPNAGAWALDNGHYSETYVNQPFVGNGYLGIRIPAAGEGYWVGSKAPDDGSSWPLYTPRYTSSLVSGFYGEKAYLSALPNITTLSVGDREETYDPMTLHEGQVSDYIQTTDMGNGVVTTKLTWTTHSGNSAQLVWRIFAHRNYAHLAIVRLDVMPLHWAGPLKVNAILDMRGIRRAIELRNERKVRPDENSSEVTIVSNSLNTKAALALRVIAPPKFHGSAVDNDTQCGLNWSFAPVSGQTYSFTKYVGVATDVDTDSQKSLGETGRTSVVNERARAVIDLALKTSLRAGNSKSDSYETLLKSHEAAWRTLWQSDVIVDQSHEHLQAVIHASEYMLYSNVRAGARNSIAPAGLTSDNYAGMIFWDAETWMYPYLLAMHPELARSIIDYRYDKLPNALLNTERNVEEIKATRGSYFPWTSGNGLLAVDGGETDQIHLQADIALAQYQYFLATGDKQWLRRFGWPVLRSIADYYSSRTTRNSDGSFSIVGVDGPDEYTHGATDAAYTNGGALRALDFAREAASVLGIPTPSEWTHAAENLVRPLVDSQRRIHLQYKGFDPDNFLKIKQADVILLTYPMEYAMSSDMAVNDLRKYSAITDPLGPSMTNSVQAIIAAQYSLPDLAKFFMDSYEPYLRGPYLNFNETAVLTPSAGQGNPAYTFLTGSGGFLQVFTHGFAGYRSRQDALWLAPVLPLDPIEGSPLRSVYLKGMHWQGRTFDIDISPSRATILLQEGQATPAKVFDGVFILRRGRPQQVRVTHPSRARLGETMLQPEKK